MGAKPSVLFQYILKGDVSSVSSWLEKNINGQKNTTSGTNHVCTIKIPYHLREI